MSRLSTLLQGAKRQKVALAEPLVPTIRTSTRVRVPTKFEDAAKLTDSDGEEDAGKAWHAGSSLRSLNAWPPQHSVWQ